MPSPQSPAARELAQRLLERETAGETDVARLGEAMQRVYSHVSKTLSRFVGDDGYRALLTRALTRAGPEHTVWKNARRDDATGPHLDVARAVEGHGAVIVGTALESLVAALVEILSDLIGADMVRNLLDHDDATQARSARRRE
jgi:hypothetical protein